MATPSLVDLSPLVRVVLLGAAFAVGPFLWVMWKQRGTSPADRLRGLTLLTLFLTFDLVVFGAFTRLTDSGLGCPDWPGCYGHASPFGAQAKIAAEQLVLPSGPVTHGKAWVEMIHRYLATAVGLLIMLLVVLRWRAWRRDRRAASPAWAVATLVWVCIQGAFGAFTVTLKLYPAVVTLHLLGGLGLLALLAAQVRWPTPGPPSLGASALRAAVRWVLVLAVLQAALGGWVSANYAVLACSDFPTCQGVWWPVTDFANGFALLRPLGQTPGGAYLPFAALTAIHVAHRLGALFVVTAVGWLAAVLLRRGGPALRRPAFALIAIALWQVTSGLANVVLGWPMVAALAHTGGAAALIGLLAALLTTLRGSPRQVGAWRATPLPAAIGPAGAGS